MKKDIIIVACAKTAHEVNRSYCNGLGDRSQEPWDVAPDWQQASALEGARFVLANPTASSAASHESWLAEKESLGWKWGEVKDAELKTHPCIVAFHELPLEQQEKDRLFKSAVIGVAASLGWDD